jgi:flagellar biosynthesis/type III secretory pathway protein FliH
MGRVVKGRGRVVSAAVMDARARADELVEMARREAERLVAEAQDRHDEVLSRARDEGRAQAAAEVAALLAAGRAEAGAMLERARPAALTIAAKMAEKIVGRAVALEPSVMAEIAAEALAACRTRDGVVTLRVHPEHLGSLEERRATLAGRLGGAASLAVVADETIERMGCVVDTPVGRVDARLPTLLAHLTAAAREGHGEGDV